MISLRRILFLLAWLLIPSGFALAQSCTATSEREWTSHWVYVVAAPVKVVTATGHMAVGHPLYVYKRKFKVKFVCCVDPQKAAVWVDGNYAFYLEEKFTVYPVIHLGLGMPLPGALGVLADAVFADLTIADRFADQRAVDGEKPYDPLPDENEPSGKREILQPAPKVTCGKEVRLADGTRIRWSELEHPENAPSNQATPEQLCERRCATQRQRWTEEQRIADGLEATAKGLEKALGESQGNLSNAQTMLAGAKARLEAADKAVKAYQDEAKQKGVDVSIFGTRYSEQLAAQTSAQRDVSKWQSEVNRLTGEVAELSKSATGARGRADSRLKVAREAKDAYDRCKGDCAKAENTAKEQCDNFWGLRGTCLVDLGPKSVDYYRESDGSRAKVTLSPHAYLGPGQLSFLWQDTVGYHGIKVEVLSGKAGDQYWILYEVMSVMRATFDVGGKKVTVQAHDGVGYSSPAGQAFDIPQGATGLESIEIDAFGKTLKWTAKGR